MAEVFVEHLDRAFHEIGLKARITPDAKVQGRSGLDRRVAAKVDYNGGTSLFLVVRSPKAVDHAIASVIDIKDYRRVAVVPSKEAMGKHAILLNQHADNLIEAAAPPQVLASVVAGPFRR